MSEHEVVFDEYQSQLRVHLTSGQYAQVDYQLEGGVIIITSTRIPQSLRGKGYGRVMMESLLPTLAARQLTIVPRCSYVEHYLSRHPQWHHLWKRD